jgi:hypothetical protein
MTKTFSADRATFMSARTAKYVEAMIREGDDFDYDKWLKRVREEEADAKQAEATGSSGELAAAEINRPTGSSTSDSQHKLTCQDHVERSLRANALSLGRRFSPWNRSHGLSQ